MNRSTFLPVIVVVVLAAILAQILRALPVGLRAEGDPPSARGRVGEPSSSFAQGLGALPQLTPMRSRSISAENPTGAKGRGGMAVPDPPEKDPPDSGRAADVL